MECSTSFHNFSWFSSCRCRRYCRCYRYCRYSRYYRYVVIVVFMTECSTIFHLSPVTECSTIFQLSSVTESPTIFQLRPVMECSTSFHNFSLFSSCRYRRYCRCYRYCRYSRYYRYYRIPRILPEYSQNNPKILLEYSQNTPRIIPKIVKKTLANLWKIYENSMENQWKINENRWKFEENRAWSMYVYVYSDKHRFMFQHARRSERSADLMGCTWIILSTRQRWFVTECPPIFQFSTLWRNARQFFNFARCHGMLVNLSI